MADRFERWNKWAPRYIADYMHDFEIEDWKAAAFPGNFAAESGYFNFLQEINPIVPGSRGGLGHAQWTGPRRLTFEAWLKRKGWKVDSYEGNYSMSYRELKGSHSYVMDRLKKATSLENAVWIVGKYYEGPAVLNLNPRIKAAKEALALYKKNPPPPTVWPTDKDEPMPITPSPVTPPVAVAPVPVPVAPDTSRPAVPWYKSLVFTGSAGSLGATIVAMGQAYQPGVPFLNQLDTMVPLGVAALTAAMALIGRVTSTAQPLTTSQAAADKIGAAQTAATAVVAASNVQYGVDSVRPVQEAWNRSPPLAMAESPSMPPPLSDTERAAGWTTVQPQPIPMSQLSIDQWSQEMPEAAQKLIGIVTSMVPMLGAIAQVAELGKALEGAVKPGERKP